MSKFVASFVSRHVTILAYDLPTHPAREDCLKSRSVYCQAHLLCRCCSPLCPWQRKALPLFFAV